MYDELIKDLREWPRVCVEYTGSLDELHDKAAEAIEKLQKRVPKRPHGRLIDADALKQNTYEIYDPMGIIEAVPVDVIDSAPTVIEAEEQSGNSGELED